MFEFLEDFGLKEYFLTHKIVLASYILFGSFILKLLIGRVEKFKRNDRNILITYVIFLMLFAGTRAKNIGVDTGNYYLYFFIPATRAGNIFDVFTILNTDFLFELIISLTAWTNNYNIVLLTIAIVLNVLLYKFVREFTDYGNRGSSLLLFLTIASGFSFINLEINIMRNALAIGFIFLSINYAIKENYYKCALLLITALLFHRTSIILAVIIFAIVFAKKVPLKYYYAFYLLAILLSAVGFGFHSISFLAELGNEDLSNLSYEGETNYRIGFRLDFVMFNTFFLILFAKFTNLNSYRESFLIKYFILSSVVFFFNFYIPFSDRFGLFSWLIIPLLLFDIVNKKFPKKKIFINTLVLISFYILNNIILFPTKF
tara:strand:+ start:298 stop:1416 length:1119 start_codon:yes stop_codon:yes gene_type:complete